MGARSGKPRALPGRANARFGLCLPAFRARRKPWKTLSIVCWASRGVPGACSHACRALPAKPRARRASGTPGLFKRPLGRLACVGKRISGSASVGCSVRTLAPEGPGLCPMGIPGCTRRLFTRLPCAAGQAARPASVRRARATPRAAKGAVARETIHQPSPRLRSALTRSAALGGAAGCCSPCSRHPFCVRNVHKLFFCAGRIDAAAGDCIQCCV